MMCCSPLSGSQISLLTLEVEASPDDPSASELAPLKRSARRRLQRLQLSETALEARDVACSAWHFGLCLFALILVISALLVWMSAIGAHKKAAVGAEPAALGSEELGLSRRNLHCYLTAGFLLTSLPSGLGMQYINQALALEAKGDKAGASEAYTIALSILMQGACLRACVLACLRACVLACLFGRLHASALVEVGSQLLASVQC
jgi:hypothetical protein